MSPLIVSTFSISNKALKYSIVFYLNYCNISSSRYNRKFTISEDVRSYAYNYVIVRFSLYICISKYYIKMYKHFYVGKLPTKLQNFSIGKIQVFH